MTLKYLVMENRYQIKHLLEERYTSVGFRIIFHLVAVEHMIHSPIKNCHIHLARNLSLAQVQSNEIMARFRRVRRSPI